MEEIMSICRKGSGMGYSITEKIALTYYFAMGTLFVGLSLASLWMRGSGLAIYGIVCFIAAFPALFVPALAAWVKRKMGWKTDGSW